MYRNSSRNRLLNDFANPFYYRDAGSIYTFVVLLLSAQLLRELAMISGQLKLRISRCRIEAGELLQNRHHVLGLAPPAHPYGQAKATVLVELEVHGPDLVRVLGLMAPH